MRQVFLIADTHFGHENIISYCNRPFRNAVEMDEVLISNWNSVVGENDTVFHLGDFALATSERIKEFASALSGKKVLIKGNHDRKTGSFWRRLGFEYYRTPIILYGALLSHHPVMYPELPNIHGHTHTDTVISGGHVCVSCECIGYTPVKYSEIFLRFLGRQKAGLD